MVFRIKAKMRPHSVGDLYKMKTTNTVKKCVSVPYNLPSFFHKSDDTIYDLLGDGCDNFNRQVSEQIQEQVYLIV